MKEYKNIFLTDTSVSYDFSSIPKMGSTNIPKIENRQTHVDNLLQQYKKAQQDFNSYTPQQVSAISYKTGTCVEFSSVPGFDLISKSLEDQRQGIRLLNVRDYVEENDEKSNVVTRATVFIPTGKEEFFLNKISSFIENTSKGKPKNNDLISSIGSISNAIRISAFWIGNPADMPGDTKKWYELWIDSPNDEMGDVISKTFELFSEQNIECKNKKEIIVFPERFVVLVRVNCQQILDLIKNGACIAEIHKPADPNVFFLDSELNEQDEWVKDLLQRTSYTNNNVSVCVLDTGVNDNHVLIKPYMSQPGLSVDITWGTLDNDGHGTNMAGVVLYNDLKQNLLSQAHCVLNHSLESVKIIDANNPNPQGLYGYITETATLLPEINDPKTKRVYCMAVTDSTSSTNDGQPSSWSAAIDRLSFSDSKRLYVISAGNTSFVDLMNNGYPHACLKKSVEDPAQSWNSITVGAYSIDTQIKATSYTKGYVAVAKYGELSPYSSTCCSWKKQWPIKPEVVCDGGNMATDGTNYTNLEDLSKLTLNKNISTSLFDCFEATSAATAQCSYIAGEIMAEYPNLWPETIRALIIHSARWTDSMKAQFGSPDTKTQGRRMLLRTCGYGVPDLDRAKKSLDNRVNLIIEDELQPYEKLSNGSTKMKEMRLHEIPWPKEILESLENTSIKIRITLSYFIEPGPGQKGWKNKYRYASCGLRFDIKHPSETVNEFIKRINKKMRDDDYQSTSSNDNWYLGPSNRDVGSIHSDVWEGSAIDLAQSNYISIYPVVGWWRERTNLKKFNSKIRYALIVSVESPTQEVDLYTPILNMINNKIAVSIESNNELK